MTENIIYLRSSNCQAYTCWSAMSSRVGRIKEYKDCTISDEWKDFQTFAQWYYSQDRSPYESYHIDKDMLVRGNRHYSKETCCLIPGWINHMISRKQNTGKYPTCVSFSQGKYRGRFNFNGRTYQMKACDTEAEMCKLISDKRRELVNKIADEYERDKIMSPKAIQGFRNYDFTVYPKNP